MAGSQTTYQFLNLNDWMDRSSSKVRKGDMKPQYEIACLARQNEKFYLPMPST
jgi:hypothetical protein